MDVCVDDDDCVAGQSRTSYISTVRWHHALHPQSLLSKFLLLVRQKMKGHHDLRQSRLHRLKEPRCSPHLLCKFGEVRLVCPETLSCAFGANDDERYSVSDTRCHFFACCCCISTGTQRSHLGVGYRARSGELRTNRVALSHPAICP